MTLPFHDIHTVESTIIINSDIFISFDYISESCFFDMLKTNILEFPCESDFTDLVRDFNIKRILDQDSDYSISGIHNIFNRIGSIIKIVKTNLKLVNVESIDVKSRVIFSLEILSYEIQTI